MDKRQHRTLKKLENIRKAALELFTAHGFDKVSMDEIAEKANVSKVTIYKYFPSKDNLYSEVINLWIDETLSDVEAVLNSDMDFFSKLRFMLTAQTASDSLAGFDTLYQVWENEEARSGIQQRLNRLMKTFYDEGQQKGLIHETLSFETLLLYAEVFRTGIKATFLDNHITMDPQVIDALYDVFFFGIIKRE